MLAFCLGMCVLRQEGARALDLDEGHADVPGQMCRWPCGLTVFQLQRWVGMNEDFFLGP